MRTLKERLKDLVAYTENYIVGIVLGFFVLVTLILTIIFIAIGVFKLALATLIMTLLSVLLIVTIESLHYWVESD